MLRADISTTFIYCNPILRTIQPASWTRIGPDENLTKRRKVDANRSASHCIFNKLRVSGGGPKNADKASMNTNSINGYYNSNIASVLSSALQGTGLSTNSTSTTSGVNSTTGQSDSSQLSPFAQLLSTLQQLQQSNPTQYAQVTKQIATNLTSAAATATKDGNTGAASQLTQLATDFTNASQTGQLPNIQDLAAAVGGGGHGHHHHAHGSSSDSDSSSSSSSSSSTAATSSSSTSQSLQQLLAAFQQGSSAQTAQSASFNPMSIIMNTLSNAGITATS